MTPEERFEIDKKIQALVEVQVKHDQRIKELAERTDALFARTDARFERTAARIDERFKRTDQQIDENTAGIRDLIAISRTLIDSKAETEEKLKHLTVSLDRLSDTVNAFIKSQQKPNGKN
jgi:ABC-type transporter Mla subunit MlaD